AGTATPVTVELTTPGGNTVSATYTPTVTEKPGKPGKPVDPKPGKPGKPVDPKPGKPGKPVDPKPGKPSKPAPQTPEANKSHKGSLPMTGSSALTALGVALVLAVGGSTTVVAVRRRNKA
ncbi:LPXTG cell wall anchor domain-containing protein, partial [Arcanobacterium canis]